MNTAKITPMMEQYFEIKAQVPDAFLFFRLGDFYELFYEDAIEAARELEITLTARGKKDNEAERIPMCGVPYHSAEQYIARLVNKGYKVAICEQVENPAEAKGVVRREIVRIVTPGTIMEEKSLDSSANNFLVCLAQQDASFGFTCSDLSTGEVYLACFNDFSSLANEISTYGPAEIIMESAVKPHWDAFYGAEHKQLLTIRESFHAGNLQDIFPAFHETDTPLSSVRSLRLLLSYLEDTQKRSLSHFTRVQFYEAEQFMVLDPFTRRNLELVETAREGNKQGSLLWLLDETATAPGARLLRRWMDKPLLTVEGINTRQEIVGTLVDQWMVREDLRSGLNKVYDLERLIGRISFGTANARDLNALKLSLAQVPVLFEACQASGSEHLQKLAAETDDCQELHEWIKDALVEEPPISLKEGALIREGYDERLDKLREASVHGKRWIAELERAEREATGIKSLKVGYNRVFGYYIEVTRANLNQLPEGRYERKQTLTNAERFITPELKEKEALILEAEEKMVDIEYDLFFQLRERLANENERLQRLAEAVAQLDVYQALGEVSAKYRFTRPTIHNGYDLDIHQGRHPVVEKLTEIDRFVANDTGFEKDETRIMLITGPNMAGKSTYMRQVALISILAQIGCFVPAKRARLPLVDRIFTRIGAADDLSGGQSTFMVEMKDIQIMTEHATTKSLVIIDELGRGTSTAEGMAIAQAVIEYLHDRIGCKTLVSTHFHELSQMEDHLKHLTNHSMAVKESGKDVVFLRKLVAGAMNTSYGIYCAQIAGVRPEIIERAYGLMEAAPASETIQQLSLFPEPQTPPAPKMSSQADHEILKQIKEIDLFNKTPLEMMQLISEWKQQLMKAGESS